MSLFARLKVVIATVIGVGTVALVYAEVGKPLINMGTGDGQHTGAFSDVLTWVDSALPLALVLLLLGIVLWFVASSVQEERSRRVRR